MLYVVIIEFIMSNLIDYIRKIASQLKLKSMFLQVFYLKWLKEMTSFLQF